MGEVAGRMQQTRTAELVSNDIKTPCQASTRRTHTTKLIPRSRTRCPSPHEELGISLVVVLFGGILFDTRVGDRFGMAAQVLASVWRFSRVYKGGGTEV